MIIGSRLLHHSSAFTIDRPLIEAWMPHLLRCTHHQCCSIVITPGCVVCPRGQVSFMGRFAKKHILESRNFHEAVPCVYDDLNGTYKVPDKWRVHKNSSSVFGFRDDDLAKRIPADSLARTKPEPRVWKVNQTQPAKPPGPLATDWPLHHRNNLPSTLEIRYLKKVLLPDRRVPPKVIFPRDLRKQADALALSLQQAEEASKPQIPD